MSDIVIPLEMTITPGVGSMATKIKLQASGETVFDEYEHTMSDGQAELVAGVTAAYARLFSKFAQKIRGSEPTKAG